MFDLQGKGVSHHIQGVSIQDGVAGTFFQHQIEQVDGGSPLLERQAQDDAPFPMAPFRLGRVALAMNHRRPQDQRQPAVIGAFARSRLHRSLLNDPVLHGFYRPLNNRLFNLL